MKLEYLLFLYSFFKTVVLGYSVYAVLDWPLFLILPVSLILSLFPIISEGLVIYYGAQAFGTGYWWAALWFCLLPFLVICVLPYVALAVKGRVNALFSKRNA